MINEAAKEVFQEAVTQLERMSNQLTTMSNQVGEASVQIGDELELPMFESAEAIQVDIEESLAAVEKLKSKLERVVESIEEADTEVSRVELHQQNGTNENEHEPE